LSFVAEIEEEVIGFVLARLAYLGMPVAEVAVISILVVDPHY
jgi:hypothetical protein